MKKVALTLAIILGLSMTTFADPDGGGMFGRSKATQSNTNRDGNGLLLPNQHGLSGDWGDEEDPLGSGIAVLMGLGAAYLVGKKRKEE